MTTGVANSLNTNLAVSGKILNNGGPLSPLYVPVTGGGGVALLTTITASSSADMQFKNVISATYTSYTLNISNLTAGTSTDNLLLEYSTDNGASWDTTSAHYAWVFSTNLLATATSRTNTGNASDSSIQLLSSMATTGNTSLTIEIVRPAIANVICFWYGIYSQSTPQYQRCEGSGNYIAGTSINAFRIIASSGTIATATAKLYGWSA